MKNEVFITAFGIVLILFLYLANQLVGLALVALAFVLYNCHCAYYYKGQKSLLLAGAPLGIFVLFMVASVDNTLANIMMFVWLGSMIYFAMNTDSYTLKETPIIQPSGKYCSGCGVPVESNAAFCKDCGTKL